MIVNYKEDCWQIISQRAHGLLAGEICFNWKKENRPERWLETIITTAEHDDVFDEFDGDNTLLNENGGPVNYKMRPFEQRKCDELLNHATTKSRYIALLISRHIRFLYETSDDKAAKTYTAYLKKMEGFWMKEIDVTEEKLSHAYSIVQWCDAFSLLLCQNLVQPENREIEISTGPDNISYMLHSPETNKLVVKPWPFESTAFEITFESRTLKQLRFESVDEFRELLMKTTPNLHHYAICRD